LANIMPISYNFWSKSSIRSKFSKMYPSGVAWLPITSILVKSSSKLTRCRIIQASRCLCISMILVKPIANNKTRMTQSPKVFIINKQDITKKIAKSSMNRWRRCRAITFRDDVEFFKWIQIECLYGCIVKSWAFF